MRQFIGMINFYRDIWQKQSELIAPLPALTSKNVIYDWKDEHSNYFFPFLSPFITSIMAHSEQGKYTQLSRDWTKKRSGIVAPISIEDLTEKEVQSSTQDSAICELSLLADPTN